MRSPPATSTACTCIRPIAWRASTPTRRCSSTSSQRAGVEVVFLNRPLGQSPEDDLLLQVQGMVAEYERAKILERSRRGKRHGAHSGVVNVLAGAPYGYRYITKHEGGGQARYEVLLEEARVVRQVFDWVGRERLSIGEVVRRLNQAQERTRTGKTVWDRSTVWGILKNPAYKGTAAFGKTRADDLRPRLRTQRGRPAQPRRARSPRDVPPEEWIAVPVPAVVSEELFATVQEQLAENRQRARQGQRGARYLLQGLICCALCGYAYYGKAISPSAAKYHDRHYAYYRCVGSDAYRFGGQRLCHNKQVRTDLVDLAVWTQVRTLLEHPERLQEEYQRRLEDPGQQERHTDSGDHPGADPQAGAGHRAAHRQLCGGSDREGRVRTPPGPAQRAGGSRSQRRPTTWRRKRPWRAICG